MHAPHHVFVSGATGYLGRALTEALIARDHTVHGLARPASAHRLVTGVQPVLGDALGANSYVASVPPADTFVHLVGTPSPHPGKAAEFRAVDLNSVEAAIAAAHTAAVQHLVYVSVAQPAPVMRAYVKAREDAEGLIRASGMNATILRPWYVLGPGHRWAYALKPVYALTDHIPALRAESLRLGLLTLADMTRALVHAVEHPAHGIMVLDVPAMRALPHD